jgi:hypothetical protein
VAPVELVGFSRGKAQRYIGSSRRLPMLFGPSPSIKARTVVTTIITDRIVPALTVVKALGLRSRLNVAASSVVASNAMRNPAIRSVGSDGLEGTAISGHRCALVVL